MNKNSMITSFHHPGLIIDPLTEIACEGARQMLMAALKAEAANFVASSATSCCPTADSVLSGTAPDRNGRSRPGSDRSL